MAISLNPKQVVSSEKLLVSQVGQQGALNRLVAEKEEIRLFLTIEEC